MTTPVALLLMLLPFQAAPQQGKVVTFQSAGASAAVLVAELGKVAGMPLSAAPETAGEILAVRLQNVPVQESMNQIANAVGGSWKAEGDGFQLVRTSEQANEERANELKRISKEYDAALKAMRSESKFLALAPPQIDRMVAQYAAAVKRVDEDKATEADRDLIDEVGEQSPTSRLFMDLIAGSTGRQLAQLAAAEVVVLSSQPRGYLRPFDRGQQAAVSRFFAQQATWAAAAARHDVALPRSNEFFEPGTGDEETIGGAKRVVLRYRIGSGQPSVEIELRILDANGDEVSRWADTVAPARLSGEIPKDVDPRDSMSIPPLTEAVKRGFSGDAAASARVAQLVVEGAEPLSFWAGELMLKLAEQRGRNLVANLAETIPSEWMPSDPKLSLQALFSTILSTHELAETSGWSVVKPRWPVRNRAARADRRTLAAFLQRVSKGTPLSLEEQITAAVDLPLPDANPMPWELAYVLLGREPDLFSEARMLRWIRTLSGVQRKSAERDGLPFGALTPVQVGTLSNFLFRDEQELVQDATEGKSGSTRLDDLMAVLPDGLPSGGYVKFVSRSEAVVQTSREQGEGGIAEGQVLSVDEYVRAASGSRPAIPKAALAQLRVGKRTSYLVRFYLGESLFIPFDLPGTTVLEPKWLRPSELPEPIRRRVQILDRVQPLPGGGG